MNIDFDDIDYEEYNYETIIDLDTNLSYKYLNNKLSELKNGDTIIFKLDGKNIPALLLSNEIYRKSFQFDKKMNGHDCGGKGEDGKCWNFNYFSFISDVHSLKSRLKMNIYKF